MKLHCPQTIAGLEWYCFDCTFKSVPRNEAAKAIKALASAGGLARAKKLTKKRRSEIARQGAIATNAKRALANKSKEV
jgi:hypothetical protein